ncbi:MAG: hypothetical protein AB8I08_00995 [Sandaracinaceae bacterium]
MADGITTDESRWPIVVHRTVGIPSDAAVDAFIQRADAIMARGEPHVVVFDSLQAGRATKHMRKKNLDWLRANQDQLNELCAGLALVIRSPTLRFVMSTAMLVWPQPLEHTVVSTLGEALDWADDQLVRFIQPR